MGLIHFQVKGLKTITRLHFEASEDLPIAFVLIIRTMMLPYFLRLINLLKSITILIVRY